MYYEEKIIDGVLSWRNNVSEEFKPLTAEELTARVGELEAKIRAARRALD